MKTGLIENAELIELLQKQITHELNNARLYLAMSLWLDFNGYFNLGKLYRKHYEEELIHQDKTIKLLNDRNILPETRVAEVQPSSFTDVKLILEATLIRERNTTKEWSAIWTKALMVKDIVVLKTADWFVSEQIEEESQAVMYIDKLNALGTDPCGLGLFEDWVGDQLEG